MGCLSMIERQKVGFEAISLPALTPTQPRKHIRNRLISELAWYDGIRILRWARTMCWEDIASNL